MNQKFNIMISRSINGDLDNDIRMSFLNQNELISWIKSNLIDNDSLFNGIGKKYTLDVGINVEVMPKEYKYSTFGECLWFSYTFATSKPTTKKHEFDVGYVSYCILGDVEDKDHDIILSVDKNIYDTLVKMSEYIEFVNNL